MSVKPNTANNKPATEEKTVPAQASGETTDQTEQKSNLTVGSKAAAVLVLNDAIKAVENGQLKAGITLKVTEDEDGQLQVELIEESTNKAKKLVAGAKGVFQRNKKLVLTTAGLLVASAVLKVVAASQDEPESDDVVESSDEISTEA